LTRVVHWNQEGDLRSYYLKRCAYPPARPAVIPATTHRSTPPGTSRVSAAQKRNWLRSVKWPQPHGPCLGTNCPGTELGSFRQIAAEAVHSCPTPSQSTVRRPNWVRSVKIAVSLGPPPAPLSENGIGFVPSNQPRPTQIGFVPPNRREPWPPPAPLSENGIGFVSYIAAIPNRKWLRSLNLPPPSAIIKGTRHASEIRPRTGH